MMYNYPMYGNFQQPYFPNNGAMPDQLAQLRGQQQFQQPLQSFPQPAQQAPLTTFSGTSIVWVNSEKEAMDYPVAPNSAVGLWNFNSNTLYFKQADASGKPSTETYKMIKENVGAQTPVQAPQTPTVEYVTRDEFNALQAKFEALAAQETAKPKKKAPTILDDDVKEAD